MDRVGNVMHRNISTERIEVIRRGQELIGQERMRLDGQAELNDRPTPPYLNTTSPTKLSDSKIPKRGNYKEVDWESEKGSCPPLKILRGEISIVLSGHFRKSFLEQA